MSYPIRSPKYKTLTVSSGTGYGSTNLVDLIALYGPNACAIWAEITCVSGGGNVDVKINKDSECVFVLENGHTATFNDVTITSFDFTNYVSSGGTDATITILFSLVLS